MALVLATTLKMGTDSGKVKIVPEGTPYSDLTKKEKELAKELGLLAQVQDEIPSLEEELEAEEDEEAEAEDTE
ncbi:MAG: hypothetical protein ACW99G_20220 [Candidatus Thorarchaeota archaeon]|jgi:hypothetical protein